MVPALMSRWALPTLFLLINDTAQAFQLDTSAFMGESKPISTIGRRHVWINHELGHAPPTESKLSMILETRRKTWKRATVPSVRRRKRIASRSPSTTSNNLVSHRGRPRRHDTRRRDGRKATLPAHEANERYDLLMEKTSNLLDLEIYPLGSLVEEERYWQYSMMKAWFQLLEESGSYIFPIPAKNTHSNKKHHGRQTLDRDGMNHLPTIIDKILNRIIDEKLAGNKNIRITSEMYNTALRAWATTAASGPDADVATRRSLEIVTEMQAQYEKEHDESVRPDSYAFRLVLQAFAKACAFYTSPCSRAFAKASATCTCSKGRRVSHGLALQAHETLLWMESLAATGKNDSARPNAVAYAHVMDAYAKSGDKDAGSKAEALLRYMENDAGVQPNTFCYNMVINAYTRQKRRDGAAENAERILSELEDIYRKTGNRSLQPDVVSYTSLVSAWARSNRKGYGARKAEAIVKRMEEFAMESGNPSIRPNSITYNVVLKAWCRSGESEAVENAERILNKMEEIYHITGDRTLQPDVVSYTSLVTAWTNSHRKAYGAKRAEEIVNRMEKFAVESGNPSVQPNTVTYNSVLTAWSRSGDSSAPARVLSIFRKMQKESIAPDIITFNTLVRTLVKHGTVESAQLAEDILDEMERSASGSMSYCSPDLWVYNSVIWGWSRFPDSIGAEKAYLVLLRLIQREKKDIIPDAFSFNIVLSALSKKNDIRSHERVAELTRYMGKRCIDIKPLNPGLRP